MADIIGYGATLGYSTDSGSNYTTVTEVLELDKPEVTVNNVKRSNLSSASAAHEYFAGMLESGEVAFKIAFQKSVEAALYAQMRVTLYWKVTLADSGSTWVFQGHITSFGGGGIPMDDIVTTPIKIKLTGKPVFTAGT